MEAKWHVVYTKSRWEKKVAKLLTKKRIENYCPINLVAGHRSDPKKKVYEPLFTSYVFVHVSEKQHTELKQMPGVINLMLWLNKPAVIHDNEILAIKDFCINIKAYDWKKAVVNLNDSVRVLTGSLCDYEKNIIAIKKNSIVIILPSLGYLMTAEVQKSNVEVMTSYILPLVNN